ncbi:tetratricopeptide repeat protein [Undibacterium parvum]|uniref:Tetratricopeptide repeat protein n=1 Tax=Undibacterium parvum TaxID=401471 RepID=A0A3Q9BPK7_9BURK|nr:tetratricopeptide repeat protein [Undibacterium parvum]AZP11621.1 tetratricopeptide repeat protein [Undibacterium parvum]
MIYPSKISIALLSLTLCHAASAHEYSAQLRAKKYAEVEQAVAAKLAVDATNLDALVAKTQLIILEGKESRLDEASKIAETCISAHPQSSDCHQALGNVLGTKAITAGIMSAMSYAGKIRDSFQKAIELDAQNYKARASLLQFYLQAPSFVGGGKGKAQTLIKETNQLNPTAGMLMQANFDLSDEKNAQAEALALKANTAGSDVFLDMQRDVLVSLGHSYVQEKKFADSERVFRDLSLRFPHQAVGSYGMGKSLQEQGKLKEAISYLEKSISIENSAYAYYRIGQCWQASKDNAKAILAYEKALSIKPELRKKIKTDVEEQLKSLKA